MQTLAVVIIFQHRLHLGVSAESLSSSVVGTVMPQTLNSRHNTSDRPLG
ncbi:hypothetical protein [Nostoc sp. FACHB-145]|nr:hypothetical protein [Nostoc sp. FACHB-145]MBD2472413.1 hypothetical protein [Nostoc sp. FACHB-145]